MTRSRRRGDHAALRGLAAAALALAALVAPTGVQAAPAGAHTAGIPAATVTPIATITPRTTLPAVESQVMCVTCKIPLTVAQSPQADRERAYIEELIAQGQTEAQVKQSLVAQYGPSVLALPSTNGFDLTAYLVPIAVVLFVAGLLALMLPRWRRRVRVSAAAAAGGAEGASDITPADAARLEADLARFD